jgi:phage gp46-like protein
MNDCLIAPVTGRRRTFWTTQPCLSVVDACGSECETHGLVYACSDGGDCINYAPGKQRTIVTSDWVRGLALNILLTDGQKDDTPCGWRPNARGGHWSDGYRENAGNSGSRVRYLKAHGRIADAIAELITIVRHDMQKLVSYGVAKSVDVTASYLGSNRAKLEINVFGDGGSSVNVGISGTRIANSWVWNT